MIHISGVGLLGSFLLHELRRRNVPFSWDDTETEVTAWKASTGAIMPIEPGDESIQGMGYRYWLEGACERPELKMHMEEVETVYVFASKPSRIKRPLESVEMNGTRVFWDDARSWQFDVRGFVLATRQAFDSHRVLGPPPKDVIVIRARGPLETIERPTLGWGWSRLVELTRLDRGVAWSRSGLRPAFHFSDPVRTFEQYYFYPLPNTAPDRWLAGSQTILQRAPMSDRARAEEGWDAFLETVKKRFEGQFLVRAVQPIREGWRPKPRKVHLELLRPNGFACGTLPKTWIMRPLYKSGVQCGPLAAQWVLERLL